MSYHAKNAKITNQTIFKTMTDVFETGAPPTFGSEMTKLAQWLGSEQAYYPEALPSIIAMFRAGYRRIVDWARTGELASSSEYAKAADSFKQAIFVVQPFLRRFSPSDQAFLTNILQQIRMSPTAPQGSQFVTGLSPTGIVQAGPTIKPDPDGPKRSQPPTPTTAVMHQSSPSWRNALVSEQFQSSISTTMQRGPQNQLANGLNHAAPSSHPTPAQAQVATTNHFPTSTSVTTPTSPLSTTASALMPVQRTPDPTPEAISLDWDMLAGLDDDDPEEVPTEPLTGEHTSAQESSTVAPTTTTQQETRRIQNREPPPDTVTQTAAIGLEHLVTSQHPVLPAPQSGTEAAPPSTSVQPLEIASRLSPRVEPSETSRTNLVPTTSQTPSVTLASSQAPIQQIIPQPDQANNANPAAKDNTAATLPTSDFVGDNVSGNATRGTQPESPLQDMEIDTATANPQEVTHDGSDQEERTEPAPRTPNRTQAADLGVDCSTSESEVAMDLDPQRNDTSNHGDDASSVPTSTDTQEVDDRFLDGLTHAGSMPENDRNPLERTRAIVLPFILQLCRHRNSETTLEPQDIRDLISESDLAMLSERAGEVVDQMSLASNMNKFPDSPLKRRRSMLEAGGQQVPVTRRRTDPPATRVGNAQSGDQVGLDSTPISDDESTRSRQPHAESSSSSTPMPQPVTNEAAASTTIQPTSELIPATAHAMRSPLERMQDAPVSAEATRPKEVVLETSPAVASLSILNDPTRPHLFHSPEQIDSPQQPPQSIPTSWEDQLATLLTGLPRILEPSSEERTGSVPAQPTLVTTEGTCVPAPEGPASSPGSPTSDGTLIADIGEKAEVPKDTFGDGEIKRLVVAHGMPRAGVAEYKFELDQDNVDAAKRWWNRKLVFHRDQKHICVRLVTVMKRDFKEELESKQPVKYAPWPDKDPVWCSLNRLEPTGRTSVSLLVPKSDEEVRPLCLCKGLISGTNTISIDQLNRMADRVFILELYTPTRKECDAVARWHDEVLARSLRAINGEKNPTTALP